MHSRRKSLGRAMLVLSAAAAALAPVAGFCADGDGWPVYGQNYSNTRFSPLKQIDTKNAGKLKLAFSFSLASLRSNELSPLVIGDTMYVTTSWGPKYVYALNAATGERKWTYEPEIPDDVLQYACCDVNSRGVSYSDGKIFVGRLDGKLSALDAATGKELWTAQVVDYKQGSVITSPPVVVKNKVITGFGGGEYGARGSLQAYDAATGKELWKTWLVPGPGEAGNDSWKGDSWQHGGSVAWLVGSYDPETNLVLFGTSNPSPWNSAVRSTGNGDYGKLTNLYSSSTVALDADTGQIKWYLQGTPEDAWDYDGVNEALLTDLTINGAKTPVMLKADRNGFFFVANRKDGKVISAEKYVPVTTGPRNGISPRPGRSRTRRSALDRAIRSRMPARTSSVARTGSPCHSIPIPGSSTSRPTTSAWTGASAMSLTSGASSFSAPSSRPCLDLAVIWAS